ncbi:MAG: sodium:solute symporter [Rubripirellula sp.]
MQFIDYCVLLAYFAVMIAIGLWAMSRVSDQEDYFMGGRGFGKLLQTFAAFGAGTGAHEPVQVGRTGWTSGLSGVWSALMWLFVTPVYWITAVWYRRMRHLTLGDWFVERYESRPLGVAYTLFAIIFYMFYLSTMFSAIAKFAVPLMGVETGLFGYELKYTLIPAIAAVVVLYGVLGGLTAAYWTDLIQGLFIILLSILLIPYGLWGLAARFGEPDQQSLMDGFRIMHDRVSADYFNLFSGPSSGEFPLHYILSLSLLGIVGVVVQPHFIATGGGSAKTEDEARIGLVVGNFLKRLCTVGWALTALIALALFAGSPEIAADPDRVWGVAAREILGPLNLGLVGLMLACLLAAMMSSADTYMIVTSALVVRNVYAAYINPNADEKQYVRVGRLTGLIIIVGAAAVSLANSDVFGQFKMAMELPILFAAPFWVGMYWRRANRTAVWGTIAFSLFVFFVLPHAIPALNPEMRSDSRYAATTQLVTKTFQRDATESDVARYDAWTAASEEVESSYQVALRDLGREPQADDPSLHDPWTQELAVVEKRHQAALKTLGSRPPTAELGQQILVPITSGDASIYWRGGVTPVGEKEMELVQQTQEPNVDIKVERRIGDQVGQGSFNVDFLIYSAMGMDLSTASKATLETLRLPSRLILPFLVLLILSYLTPRGSETALTRYFAKMNTPVLADPAQDRQALEQAYASPEDTVVKKLFPGSDWEFVKPNRKDILGFVASCGACALIIGFLIWLASIGA